MADTTLERAREWLLLKSTVFTANRRDDVEYVSAHMAQFADSEVRRRDEEIVSRMRKSSKSYEALMDIVGEIEAGWK